MTDYTKKELAEGLAQTQGMFSLIICELERLCEVVNMTDEQFIKSSDFVKDGNHDRARQIFFCAGDLAEEIFKLRDHLARFVDVAPHMQGNVDWHNIMRKGLEP